MMGNPMMGGGGGGMMGNPMMGGMNQGWGMYPGYNMDPSGCGGCCAGGVVAVAMVVVVVVAWL